MPDESASQATIDGHCDHRFAGVQEAFRQNFRERDELGGALNVRVDGVEVVDLWGGHCDAARRTCWERDTLVNAYSVGKGLLAVLTLILVERGELDLDAPVSRYWSAFDAAGKQKLDLRMLLAHRAGLPAVRRRLPDGSMYDWSLVCDSLASQRPYWEPGTAHGYHCNTFGYLVGEVIRRVSGRDPGAALQEWVAEPLGEEFYWGLPRRHHGRVSQLVTADFAVTEPEHWALAFPPTGDAERDAMIWYTYFNPAGISGNGVVNTEAWRLAQIPSTNGHGTARAVSKIYDALLRGGSGGLPVGAGLLREATRIHSDGDDRILGRPSRFGLGFQLTQPSRPLGPNPESFGHYGYGGSLGFADPSARIAFGYLTNRPGERWQTPRTQSLVDALYAAL